MATPKNDGKQWSKIEVDYIKSQANSGKSTEEIAKDLGRTEEAVRKKASEEGISLKPKDK